VDQLAMLADTSRRAYEPHAPVFWRPAAKAIELHRPWLAGLVEDESAGTFVHEGADGGLDGFIVATLVPSPPVYEPGGESAQIDDFVVTPPDRWVTVGAELLRTATAWAAERGAVQVVVVCGHHDEVKRQLLRDSGLFVASEWFTAPLAPERTPSAE
jgi:GNAT superfamily N-acetyltransferase